MATKGPGILYLHKDGFQLYTPLAPNLLEFHFVPEIVNDLDVINEELLTDLIKLFITNNRIPPLTIAVVIADNACFIQDFVMPLAPQTPSQPGTPPASDPEAADKNKKEAEQFLDHVPFDNVASKTFPLPNGSRVLATNQDLYDAIKAAFVKQGFEVDAVLPGLAFGNLNAKPLIDIPTAVLLLQRYSSLKQYNLTTHSPLVQHEEKEKEAEDEHEESKHTDITISSSSGEKKPQDKKRLGLLLGVFAILIILLIIVAINSMTPTTPAPTV